MLKKILALIVFTIIFTGLAIIFINQKMHGSASNNNTEITFTISEGEGAKEIAKRLEWQKIISNDLFFNLYLWKNKKVNQLKTGEFNLRSNMTIPEIVNLFIIGESESKERKITIPEGWSSKQIAEYLENENIIKQEEFLNEVKKIDQYRASYIFLKDLDPQVDTLEGFLFPDTYLIYKGADAFMIITKMLNNFDKKLTSEIQEKISKSNLSLKETIILASIVEKEAKSQEEKKIVAGIFLKRIQDNHPLQSCATVNYLLETSKKQLTTEDTKIDSPYNTYINKGLPPSPIANPGFDAIDSVVNPKQTDYYFFLNDLETGEMVFSQTLEEHNENKQKHGL